MSAVSQFFIDTAIAAADAARAVTLAHFRSGAKIIAKADCSPVTIADRKAEQCMRALILARHPMHGFLGEESGAVNNESQWRWVIDPIDGTKSFATGNPTFGTLIALLHGNRPMLGVIDHAALDERWIGVAGRPTVHNGMPCQTSAQQSLAAATIYATTPDMFAGDAAEKFARLSSACQFRVFGGDCYAYGLLACGYTDVVCEADMKAHDFMALTAVVEGAGGVISDWHGAPLRFDSNEVLACANQTLHQAALAQLNR